LTRRWVEEEGIFLEMVAKARSGKVGLNDTQMNEELDGSCWF
jgi:hypothetical protein